MTQALEQGMPAPDFSLPRDGGTTVTLSAFRGRPVIVYFYPKDMTKGCTVEAIDFTSFADRFAAIDAAIIGISADDVASHDQFIAKHDLKIILASDEQRQAITDYGVWVEKNMYGRKFMGIERATYLVDADGQIAKIWRKVRVPGHVEEVLNAAEALGSA